MTEQTFAVKIGQTSLSPNGGWCYTRKKYWLCGERVTCISKKPILVSEREAQAISDYWSCRDPGAFTELFRLEQV